MKKQAVLVQSKKAEPISDEPLLDRKKIHTCYVCMQKFQSLVALFDHKREHSESEGEDDLFEENCASQDNKDVSEDSNTEEKVKNMNVLLKNPSEPQPTLKQRKNKKFKKSTTTVKPSKDDTKENKKSELTVSTSLEVEKTNVKTPFKCNTCNVFFATSDEAKLHIPPSASKCKFSCHLCNRKFNTLYAFIVHVMQHKNDAFKNQDNSKSLYNCKSCCKNFTDCFQLRRHEITVHKKKHVQTSYSEPTEVMTTNVVVREPEMDNHFTCDLCYDIFNTKEELNSHTEFHKQLDLITEPISHPSNKDDVTVEVIEDIRDKHEIITMIQKARGDSLKVPKNTSTTIYDKFSLLPSTSVQNKKNLTAFIKEMIAPNDLKTKHSKTIYLPNIEEEKLKEKVKKINAKFKVVSKNIVTKRKKGPNPKVTESNSTLTKNESLLQAGTSLLKPVIPNTSINASSNFIYPASTSNVSSSSFVSSGNSSNYTYFFLPNGASVASAFLMAPTSVPFVANNETNSTTEEPKDISLPKIENVMSLVVTNEEDTNSKNLDPIVILDSDSEPEESVPEGSKKGTTDSDEETNLVIDETLPKIEPNLTIEEVEPDDIDDHFDEDECHSTIPESSKSDVDVPRTCSNCKTVFETSEACDSHESKKINCKRCDHQSCKVMELKSHYLSNHQTFFCWRCHFTSEILGEFIKHRSVHVCNECRGVFVDVENHGCKVKNKIDES